MKKLSIVSCTLLLASLFSIHRDASNRVTATVGRPAEAICWPSCWARKAREAAENAARSARDAVARVRKAAEETARRARVALEAAQRAAAETARRAREGFERAQRAAAETARRVKEAAEKVQQAATDAARRAQEGVEKARRIVETKARQLAEAAALRVREAAEKALRAAEEKARQVADQIRKVAEEKTRQLREAAEKAARSVADLAEKAANATAEAARRAGRAVVSAAQTVGSAVVNAANTVASAASSFASAAWEKLKSLGFTFDKIKEIFCATIGAGVCALIDVVKAAKVFVERCASHGVKTALQMTLEDLKNAITAKMDRMKSKAEEMFANFRSVLLAKDFNLANIAAFAKKNFLVLTSLAGELFKPLLPFPMGELTSAAIGGVGTAALTPALAGIAAVHFGIKKLMAYLIPKLILGAGGAFNWANDHLPPGFWKVADTLMSFASGPGGKGLLAGIFVFASPEAKEKLKRVADSLSTASGAISQGIDGVMKLARSDSFQDAEKALGVTAPKAQGPTAAPKLTPAQLKTLIDALAELAEERLVRAADAPLRKLMGKALQMMNRLLDAPRNALVAAVGSIPLVGGVVSAALNFGLGVIIDMVGESLTEQVMLLAKDVIGDVVKDVKLALGKELLGSPGNFKSAQGMVELMQGIGKVAGEVSKLAKAASGGEVGLMVSALVGAVHTHLLKGVADPDVRNVIGTGIDAVAAEVTKRGTLSGYSLGQAAADVLKAIAKPLGALVARPIENPRLKSVVGKGLESLLTQLAATGVKKVMANPRGFLNSVAVDLVRKLKPDLVAHLTDKLASPALKRTVTTAIDELEAVIVDQGFSALMPFSKLLNLAGTALARGLFDEFTELLGSNVTKAKASLQMLADKVTTMVASAKSFTEPVLASLNEGASALQSEVRGCRASITGINVEMASELFGCLKSALGSAGMAVAHKLFAQFKAVLDTDCKAALSKLTAMAGVIAKAFPALQPMAARVMGKLAQRCSAGGKR